MNYKWAIDTRDEHGYIWLGREPILRTFSTEEAAIKYREIILKQEIKKLEDDIESFRKDFQEEIDKTDKDWQAIRRICNSLEELESELTAINRRIAKGNAILVFKIIIFEHEGEALL